MISKIFKISKPPVDKTGAFSIDVRILSLFVVEFEVGRIVCLVVTKVVVVDVVKTNNIM